MSSYWETSPERYKIARVYWDVAEVIGWDTAIAFGLSVWQEKRPPSRGPISGVHGGGTGMIYIPKRLTQYFGLELIRLVGAENAELLVKAFPGVTLEFPSLVSTSIKRRNQAIAEQVAQGWSLRGVASAFELHPRQIKRICALADINMAAAKEACRDRIRSRNESVRREIVAGESVTRVGHAYGLTHKAVEKILESA